MFEVQAINSEYGKMYSATVKRHYEVTDYVAKFLGYNGVDTIVVVNIRKRGESYAGERLY